MIISLDSLIYVFSANFGFWWCQSWIFHCQAIGCHLRQSRHPYRQPRPSCSSSSDFLQILLQLCPSSRFATKVRTTVPSFFACRCHRHRFCSPYRLAVIEGHQARCFALKLYHRADRLSSFTNLRKVFRNQSSRCFFHFLRDAYHRHCRRHCDV